MTALPPIISHNRTPFADLAFLPKMHAICNPAHVITYPPLSNADLTDVMARCLERNPDKRITLQARRWLPGRCVHHSCQVQLVQNHVLDVFVRQASGWLQCCDRCGYRLVPS